MKRKLGAITIGQSPREDMVPEMALYLGAQVEILEAGALDGLSYEDIQAFGAEEDDYVLVSKLKDGRSVKFAEKHILPRLQGCIDALEAQGVDVILFLCTGVFPDVFTSRVPLLYPQRILHAVTPQLLDGRRMAVITPAEEQLQQSRSKWQESGVAVDVVAASPYTETDELAGAIEALKETQVDLIVMDCMGYTEAMKERVAGETGHMVVLSRTIVARVLGEILSA